MLPQKLKGTEQHCRAGALNSLCMLILASPLKNDVRQWGQNTCGAVQSLVSDLPPEKKSQSVFIPDLFQIRSLTGPIWWRQKQPITVQIMSAAVALPFMPDLSLYPGPRVPLCRLPLRSAPASLPGAGCPGCRLILAYLHYISPDLNETGWETSGDILQRHTGHTQCRLKQSRISGLLSRLLLLIIEDSIEGFEPMLIKQKYWWGGQNLPTFHCCTRVPEYYRVSCVVKSKLGVKCAKNLLWVWSVRLACERNIKQLMSHIL